MYVNSSELEHFAKERTENMQHGAERQRPPRGHEANLWAIRLARSQAINGQAKVRRWWLPVALALGILVSLFIG